MPRKFNLKTRAVLARAVLDRQKRLAIAQMIARESGRKDAVINSNASGRCLKVQTRLNRDQAEWLIGRITPQIKALFN